MATYYTSLSNSTPEMIEVKARLTREELSAIRRITDSKPTATFTELVKELVRKGIETKPIKVTRA